MKVLGKTARGRIYMRKFDYEEAQQRYAAGVRLSDLAREYGVSASRINQVVKPEAGQRAAERSAAYRWICPNCGAPTRGKGQRCRTCYVRLQATSVRDNELRCMSCREWKPDSEFPFNRAANHSRRERHNLCRACQTLAKRDYRRRNPSYEREYYRRHHQK